MKIAKKCINCGRLKYFGKMITEKCTHRKINSRINLGNGCNCSD
jgi:uncharacterized OB-fold protein